MDDKEFIDTALERWQAAYDAEAEVRGQALEDWDFRKGKQWIEAVKNLRESQQLPVITTNRIPRTIAMVTNEQRQQKPSTQINPVGDGADKNVAEIFQGIIRHIEVNSDAEIARDNAFEHMVTGGFGYYRIITKYVKRSFEQELFIEAVENPFSVYRDPFASLIDHSSANYYFIVSDISPEDYKDQFGTSELASLNLSATGNVPPGWITKEAIRIAEYFYIEHKKVQLYMLDDGKITEQKPDDKGLIVQEREDVVKKIKWAKINGVEVLKRRDWAGEYAIPIIPVYGDASRIDGKLHMAGLVRDAKDPQRAYNYWISRAAEACQVAPKAPYVAAAGQIEDFKEIWDRANTGNFSVLPYKAIEVGGSAVPPPQRNVAEPPIQAMAEMIRQSDNDFKVATGVFDPSLGKPGPEQSGKAILARQKQTDISISNFSDNLARSIRHEARILLDAIPKVYPPEKLQRIINPDQTVEHVPIKNSQAAVQ